MDLSEAKFFVNSLRSTLTFLEVSLRCSIVYILAMCLFNIVWWMTYEASCYAIEIFRYFHNLLLFEGIGDLAHELTFHIHFLCLCLLFPFLSTPSLETSTVCFLFYSGNSCTNYCCYGRSGSWWWTWNGFGMWYSNMW